MDKQAAYDKVRRHLLRQKKRSLDPRSEDLVQCRYRGEGGLKCAIGCLIPDELYDPVIEGLAVPWSRRPSSGPQLRFEEILKELGFGARAMAYLSQLQDIHDIYEPGEWSGELDNFARQHHLRK